MADSFGTFSNPSSMDYFPSFKNFHAAKDNQGAFTIDKRDMDDIEKKLSTKPLQKSEKSKKTQASSNKSEKTNSNPEVQCDICSVPISGPIVYNSHVNGKKHQTRLATLIAKTPEYKPLTYEELCSKKQETAVVNTSNENPIAASSESTVEANVSVPPLIPMKKLNCNTCNISCNSQQMFDNHVAGKKHQSKVKMNPLTNPAPPRLVPDNNPSSSNYCDMCSVQLNSENELTEHMNQTQHQTRVKEAEFCVKETPNMNIKFEDYKVTTADIDSTDYCCTKCNHKSKNKVQLIEHLKSAHHQQSASQQSRPPTDVNRGNHRNTQRGTMRGGAAVRPKSSSSFRDVNKPAGRLRPYRPQTSSWNRSERNFNQQTSTNSYSAFNPDSQPTYPSNKRFAQAVENYSEYDAFFSKRTRTYDDASDAPPPSFYPNDRDYYQPSNNEYNNQSMASQPSWRHQSEPQYYDSGPDYMNPMHYSSNEPPLPPPLPNYEPPPLPNYPPASSHSHYSQNAVFYDGNTKNPINSNYYQAPFHY